MTHNKTWYIWIVDDEPNVRDYLSDTLLYYARKHGVEFAFELLADQKGLQQAMKATKGAGGHDPDLVILDDDMGDTRLIGFTSLISGVKSLYPRVPVLCITGRGSVQDPSPAGRAMMSGATDFMHKSVINDSAEHFYNRVWALLNEKKDQGGGV